MGTESLNCHNSTGLLQKKSTYSKKTVQYFSVLEELKKMNLHLPTKWNSGMKWDYNIKPNWPDLELRKYNTKREADLLVIISTQTQVI